MEQALLLLADGAQYRAPEYSLAETVIGLMATLPESPPSSLRCGEGAAPTDAAPKTAATS
jgi:hypothetical protein